MKKVSKFICTLTVSAAFSCIAASAYALPSLQLGDGTTGDWSYDSVSDTWVTTSSSFEVNAYANADSQLANGTYAWDPTGSSTQTAYLVFAAVPHAASATDVFDISVMNDGGLLSLYTSGYGAPPIEDPNSLAPHGIYDSYFEVYEFNFDGLATTIFDTQPGETGSGEGFMESFMVSINSLDALVTGIHMDLFTVSGDGILALGSPQNRSLVKSFAPFSHDAETTTRVPEPASMILFGTGIIGLLGWRRKN